MSAPGTRHIDAWARATSMTPVANPTHVAVFDDERPGMLTLYMTDGKNLSPARDVGTNDRASANVVLEAWSQRTPLLDLRRDKSIPLPGRVAPEAAEVAPELDTAPRRRIKL